MAAVVAADLVARVGTTPQLPVLTRAHTSLVRQLLRDKQVRAREEAFVLEGAKACFDLISRYPQSILSLVVSPRYFRLESDADRRMRTNLPVRQFVCSDLVFEKLTDVERPQGVLAVVRQPRWDEHQVLGQSTVLGIYGDRLQDPANVGAIIRTAAGLNLSGVWLSAECADPFGPKVVRATAGTFFSVPVFYDRDVRIFSSSGCKTYSAIVAGAEAVPIRRIRKIPGRLMIAVGNEGMGLSPEVTKASDVTFTIPLAPGVESLNVAATVAISAFYFKGLSIDSGR